MPELQKSGGNRHLFLQEFDANVALESITVIDGIFQTCVRESEPDLQQVHAEQTSIPRGGRPRFPAG